MFWSPAAAAASALALAVKLAESGFQRHRGRPQKQRGSGRGDAVRPIEGNAGGLSFRACDLAAVDEIPNFVKTLRGEFGRFHGLVNNAGLGTGGLLASMKDDAIEALIRLNVLSPIVLTRHVVRSMMDRPRGPDRQYLVGGRGHRL